MLFAIGRTRGRCKSKKSYDLSETLRPYVFTDRDTIHCANVHVRTRIHTCMYTHSEGNQERSRMNQLIACTLCAGEIKKVGFQVDASVNASAANFPIPNIYSRSRFTLAISIIAICSWPIIVADTRGRSAYGRVIMRANCTRAT